jgi:hypothetical protein
MQQMQMANSFNVEACMAEPGPGPEPAPGGETRGLTAGEIEIARSVFGNSIDYGKVRIHNSSYVPGQGDNIVTPNGELYCGSHYSEDFSKTNPRIFIHEMTHVWQYQNNILDPRVSAMAAWAKCGFKYANAYAYQADPSKDLMDYNLEQQADMVADYFTAKRDGRREQADIDRESVLSKFIANPSYAAKLSLSTQILMAVPTIITAFRFP